jgi:serine/threonine protein kinase
MESGYAPYSGHWCCPHTAGITALHIADGAPPYMGESIGKVPAKDKQQQLTQTQVMLKIVNEDPPGLREPTRWSNSFNDFVRTCLRKDPKARPTAAELLQVYRPVPQRED